MAISPTISSTPGTLRPDLAGMFQEFDVEANMQGFIATQIFPVIEVALQSDTFSIMPIEEMLKYITDAQLIRASGAPYGRIQFGFEPTTYATTERGIEGPIDHRQARLYRHYLDAEVAIIRILRHIIMLNMEMEAVEKIFNPATWTPDAVTNEWDDWANATPIVDVTTKKHAIREACGLAPNTIVMSYKVFDHVRNCAEILDRIKAVREVTPQKVTINDLRAAFEIEKVLVGKGTKKTTQEGVTPPAFADIWDDQYIWIGRTADTNDIQEPCVGRTFHWSEDGSSMGGTIETYGENPIRGDVARVRNERQMKVIYTACGGLLSNIIS